MDIPAVSEDERRASGSTAGTDDHRSSRMRAVAQVKARPPKFLTAVRQLLRGAPALCPSYSTNPLVTAGDDDVETADGDICEPCDDDDTRELARRWARDATALSDWKSLPPQLDVTHPEGGGVPRARGARKREQLVNVFLFVAPLLRRKPTAKVVDFGCGGGHQTLPLAYHFPDASFVLVDAKSRSLDVAERRAGAAGLANVRCVLGLIEDFHEDFDVGVALHACGGASDAAMEKCVRANAAYVMAPCCVGKIALAASNVAKETGGVETGVDGAVDGAEGSSSYPRSSLAASVVTPACYVSIARAADFGGDGYDACGAVAGGARWCPAADSSEEEEDDERDTAVCRSSHLREQRQPKGRVDAPHLLELRHMRRAEDVGWLGQQSAQLRRGRVGNLVLRDHGLDLVRKLGQPQLAHVLDDSNGRNADLIKHLHALDDIDE